MSVCFGGARWQRSLPEGQPASSTQGWARQSHGFACPDEGFP